MSKHVPKQLSTKNTKAKPPTRFMSTFKTVGIVRKLFYKFSLSTI